MSERYASNPFVENLMVPIGKKQVRLSKIGADTNILVNQSTGEVQGTHVTTYKKVDSEQFVKLFTANIALTFDLKAAGIKTFTVLMWTVQNKALAKDLVMLDSHILNDFLGVHKEANPNIKLSIPTFKRGLAELEKAGIIAKAMRLGWYFINPNFVFNGDRIAFTTMIERRKKGEEEQLGLDLGDQPTGKEPE